jgi:hypothetical protein
MQHAIEDLDFYGESSDRSSEKDPPHSDQLDDNDYNSISATYRAEPCKFKLA